MPYQNLVKPNGFGDICEKLLCDPYVLLLVTAAMFSHNSKIPPSVCAGYPKKQSYKLSLNSVQ